MERVRKPKPAYRGKGPKPHPVKTQQLCVHCGNRMFDYEVLQGFYCFKCIREMKNYLFR